MSKLLCPNGEGVCILIADGTYIYIEKRSNYSLQKHSYSVHKGRNLLKKIITVSSTGYILDVFGLYFSVDKDNDSNFLTLLMKSDASALREWVDPRTLRGSSTFEPRILVYFWE